MQYHVILRDFVPRPVGPVDNWLQLSTLENLMCCIANKELDGQSGGESWAAGINVAATRVIRLEQGLGRRIAGTFVFANLQYCKS